MPERNTTLPGPDTIKRLRFAADSAFAMLAGMQLDVFTPLKNGPKTAAEIADAIGGVDANRLRLLLHSLVPAGLLDVKDGVFTNSPEANRFLVYESPDYLGHIHPTLLKRWHANLKTAESIRSGEPQAKVDFSAGTQQELETFLRRIKPRTIATAEDLLTRVDLSAIKTLVDVGGGAGGLAVTVAKACPHIRVTVVDLPLVTPITKKIVAEDAAGDRVEVVTADVTKGLLPGAYDAAVLKSVIHVLAAGDAQNALKNTAAAIKPGGMIYVVGEILDNSRISPLEALGQNLTFINDFDAGEAYTEQEYREWLTKAGFIDIARTDSFLAGEFGLMTGKKPS